MRIATAHRAAPVVLPLHDQVIQATYLTRRTFLEHATIAPDRCQLFWPTREVLVCGTPVQIDLGFTRELERFHFWGQVRRSREDLSNPARSGLLIEVTGEDLRQFSRAFAFARGNPMALGRRASLRRACRFEASLELDGATSAVRLADLSRGGAFVETRARALSGSHARLTIKVGFFKRIHLTARVAWSGQRGTARGVGLEFIHLDADDSARLTALLKKLAG